MPWTESSWQLAPGGGSPVVSSIMGGIQKGTKWASIVASVSVTRVEALKAGGHAGDRVFHCHVAKRSTLRKLNRPRNGGAIHRTSYVRHRVVLSQGHGQSERQAN